jgi:hypothetical protein
VIALPDQVYRTTAFSFYFSIATVGKMMHTLFYLHIILHTHKEMIQNRYTDRNVRDEGDPQ